MSGRHAVDLSGRQCVLGCGRPATTTNRGVRYGALDYVKPSVCNDHANERAWIAEEESLRPWPHVPRHRLHPNPHLRVVTGYLEDDDFEGVPA